MIITDTEARQSAALPVQRIADTPEDLEPSMRELLGAAGRVQNTVLSAGQALGTSMERMQARTRRQAMGETNEGYNPYSSGDVKGYEPWARSFKDAETPEDVAIIKRQIDRENEDRRLLDAGGVSGFVAQLAAGVVDPINIIPVGGAVVRSARLAEDVARSAARAAAAGGAVAVGAEAALQAAQETRTAGESAVTIGASALLSGLLGAAAPLVREAIPSLRARVARDLTPPPAGELDPLEPGSIAMPTSGSAGAMRVAQMDAQLKGALGVEKLISFASPILRTVRSESGEVRRAAVQLTETPFYLTDNAAGVASPMAVETRIKMWQAPLSKALEEMDRLFVEYRGGGGELTRKAFKEEVGRAMRRLDTHAIPEVQAAAQVFRTKLFDPTKRNAIAVGLLPEDVQVKGADSYLSRVYNVQKIQAQRAQFVATLTRWLKTEQGGDEIELRALAEDITDHILSVPEGRIPYENIPLHRGPTQERVLNVPDEMIEPWLESDIELVSRFYARTIVPDIEISRTFGKPDMAEAVAKIREDYQKLIDAAQSEAAAGKLAKQRDADIKDIAAMRDRLRGTYGAPADPSGFFVRGSRVVRNWNYLSLMGSMTVSSIPDLARPIMVHGVIGTLRDGLIPLVSNFPKFKLAAAEAKRAGTALEMVLDSRAMELSDIGDVYGRHSTFERGLQALVDRYGKYTLMSPWNAALKQFSSVITQHEILRSALKGGDIERMAMAGIDPEMAGRIAQQFNQHGDKSGAVWLANTLQWTDRDAKAAFRAAVVKEVDRTIVSPGVGDRPLWMSTELGKVVGQFKTFSFASTQRVMLAALQQRDMAALNGALLSIGLGSMIYGLHGIGDKKELSDDPAVWVREGVDRSGIIGWLYEAGNITEKFTKGAIGWRSLTGGEESLRYASRGVAGALAGPSIGSVEDLAKATGGTVTGEFGESDVKALRRLVPFQNLFYLRWLFDQAQDQASEAIVE